MNEDMKNWASIYLYVACFVLFAAVVYFFIFISHEPQGEVALCAQDIMQCPNGSYVSRHAPTCEFSACVHIENGFISGHIFLSPTCPVERIPPDPSCAPKGYQTIVMVIGGDISINIDSDIHGFFSASLPIGNYQIQAKNPNNAMYPRCGSSNANVTAHASTTVDIYCDTGIR